MSLSVLVIVAFAALIAWRGFVKWSDAVQAAEAFVRGSSEIQTSLGNDLHLGWFPWISQEASSNVTTGKESGRAHYTNRVSGSLGSGEVSISLNKQGGMWHIVAADFKTSDGRTQSLLKQQASPPTESGAGTPIPQAPPSPDESAKAHVARGHQYYRENNFPLAIAEYDKALSQIPPDTETYYWRGLALLQTGRHDEALQDAKQVIALDPDRIDAYVLLDRILEPRSEWDTILESWNGFLARHPDSGQAYYERGGTYWRKGDRTSSLQDAEKACSLGYAQGCQIYNKLKRMTP